ncbi:DUF1178 family protein, partial [Brevirhabdus pacifica]|uniref:DUF1178 family protein n=1 Tax=Brevirhabdus pacifica TaxID=1267768 RepID=UPI002FCE1828
MARPFRSACRSWRRRSHCVPVRGRPPARRDPIAQEPGLMTMIRYALKCGNTHDFDSWFASAEGFDMQQAAGLVACPVCNSTDVEKSV